MMRRAGGVLLACVGVWACGLNTPSPTAEVESSESLSSESEGASAETGTDTSEDSDDEGSDEVKLDMGDLPPDPFAPGELGCDPAPMVGPMIEIDSAGAWLDELGLIRVRLVDSGPEHSWDMSLDLSPADTLPASYIAVEFSGDLSEPALFEWSHGSISGVVDLELVSAEPGGCLVAEIQASSNDWYREAPPLGWIVTPLLPWPEDP